MPGQIFNRRMVAEELNVSIAPVLEAMVRLEAEGLLTTLPRKGTQVRLVRPADIADQMNVREAIECQAARFYCGEPVEKHDVELKQLAVEVDSCEEGSMTVWKKEIAFHRRLVELSGSKALVVTFQQVMHLGVLCAANFSELLPGEHPLGNHTALVDHLKTDNPDLAQHIIRAHIRAGKRVQFHPANDIQIA